MTSKSDFLSLDIYRHKIPVFNPDSNIQIYFPTLSHIRCRCSVFGRNCVRYRRCVHRGPNASNAENPPRSDGSHTRCHIRSGMMYPCIWNTFKCAMMCLDNFSSQPSVPHLPKRYACFTCFSFFRCFTRYFCLKIIHISSFLLDW